MTVKRKWNLGKLLVLPGVGKILIAGDEVCMKVVADFINLIIRDGKVPKDWEESYMINLCKGKGDALRRGNCGCLKLLQNIMRVLKCIIGEGGEGRLNVQ